MTALIVICHVVFYNITVTWAAHAYATETLYQC